MIEFGVFNDEGCIESQLTEEAARAAAAEYVAEGDEWARAREMCPEHEEQPRDGCEECDAEEAEHDAEDDEDEEDDAA